MKTTETSQINALDQEGFRVCANLAEAFNLVSHPRINAPGALTIGIEIEVPWSSYFPQLWKEHGMQTRKISQMDAIELAGLTRKCSELESTLLPLLHKTRECGVPRGNDRYWEFALRPVNDSALLVEQVRLLSEAGAIPRDRKHSLHVTVGSMPRNASLYYLAMALEVEFVDPDRIREGIELTKKAIHTGWARKGFAGILEKGADELEGGAQVASEIRMLQLPKTDADFARMMQFIQWGVNAIHDKRTCIDSEKAHAWSIFERNAIQILRDHGLPVNNWSKESKESKGSGGLSGNGQQYEVWERFAQAIPQMKEDFRYFSEKNAIPPLLFGAEKPPNKSALIPKF